MVLNIRAKQIDGLTRILKFNASTSSALQNSSSTGNGEAFKVLVLDKQTKDIIAPLLKISDLRKYGVTLHLMISTERQSIPDVPAIYFVDATEENIRYITNDAASGLYDAFHLNFLSSIPPALMDQLASGAVERQCVQRIAKVHDQHLSFIALEAGLFSLGLPNSYLAINDPGANDTQIEAALAQVVDGLFSALTSLGVVPVIRCPQGGAAQHVAQMLEARIREHLKLRNNLFAEGGSGLSASLARPLLVLFDRNFELSVVLQHAWTYRPMVHDVLGMALNRITLDTDPPGGAAAALGGAKAAPKAVEVGEGDFFWELNCNQPFPKVAADVDVQLGKYKEAVQEMNRQTGANVDPNQDPSEMMNNNTRGLMNAVHQLPVLVERKRTIEKHSSLLHALLKEITSRGLDALYRAEEDMLSNKLGFPALLQALQTGKGNAEDMLRLVLVYCLTSTQLPSGPEFEKLEAALQEAGADLAALAYVRRMRRMKLTGRNAGSAPDIAGVPAGATTALGSLGGRSQLMSWADKTFGQGLTSITRGVKDLLAGEQQAAVTVALEGLLDSRGAGAADAQDFATYDPKAAPGRSVKPAGPFKEAIVFMIGGGSYLEAQSLSVWGARTQPPTNVVYGATDMLTGPAFAAQLAELGRRSAA